MTAPLLVILPHNPGDVVMALQSIARIAAARPDLPVEFVVADECRELAEGSPLIRRTHVLPRRALREALSTGRADDLLQRVEDFLAGLAASGPGHSLNLFQERYGAILQGLVPAGRKLGLSLQDGCRLTVGSRALEHLFAVPASRADNGWHAVDAYVRAARELLDPDHRAPWPAASPARGILPPLRPPVGWITPAEGSWLAFHPGSAWPGKRWPVDRWARLAETCARAGQAVILTGSPEEKETLARLRALVPEPLRASVHDWSGRTDLLEAAWIHAQASRTVTGDTVAMHLAAAAGTPVLALFGPSNPVETGPYGPGHFILQTDPAVPADLAFDREHAGLAALTAEAVAGFLLEGLPPAGCFLWETFRDARGDCQGLRDARGLRHPHQARSAGLMAMLDGRDSVTPPPAPDPGGARARVRSALTRCRGSAEAAALRALNEAEGALAAETADSLVWEAYRISVNGMPLRDLASHLQLRTARFETALREEAALLSTRPA